MNKNLNFKCSITVKDMTSDVHQKSSAVNPLVSIKQLMVASNLLVLLILSRSSLPYKRISVIKTKNIGNNTTDCAQKCITNILLSY